MSVATPKERVSFTGFVHSDKRGEMVGKPVKSTASLPKRQSIKLTSPSFFLFFSSQLEKAEVFSIELEIKKKKKTELIPRHFK